MGEFVTLADYKGWAIVWQASSGRLLARRSTYDIHDFYERPRDRITGIEIAKAWIDRGR